MGDSNTDSEVDKAVEETLNRIQNSPNKLDKPDGKRIHHQNEDKDGSNYEGASAKRLKLESTATSSNVGPSSTIIAFPSSSREETNEGETVEVKPVPTDSLKEIEIRLKKKQSILDELKRVELYNNKWSIDELKNTIAEWKDVALTTFEDLFVKSREEKESLTKSELLNYLGVDPDLIGLDLSNENSQDLD